MKHTVVEGKAVLNIEVPKIVSKEMTIFYNPVMKLNRDLTIAFLEAEGRSLRISDPLAGTGIRAIRIMNELHPSVVDSLLVNDGNEHFPASFKERLKENKVSDEKIKISNKDASVFLLESPMVDYIDIDPFGSPVPFLDAAVKKIKLGGLLAVTATDTAALCGTSVKACRRKYWSEPLRTSVMKEVAVRILIRRVQLVGASEEVALVPVLSYAHEHYFRIFFVRVRGGSDAIDQILKNHKTCYWCSTCQSAALEPCKHSSTAFGPVWTGTLQNQAKIEKALKASKEKNAQKFLEGLFLESQLDVFGFFDLHAICKVHSLACPAFSEVISELEKKKFSARRTIFSVTGIRTNASAQELLKILKKLQRKEK